MTFRGLIGASPPDSKLSAEAVRALESSPRWKPGELHGRKVPVEITIPMDFRSSN